MIFRNYTDSTVFAVLSADSLSTDTILYVESTFGFPIPNFELVINIGLEDQELCLCTSYTSNIFVVQRGYDGSIAQNHATGATIQPSVSSIDLTEINTHITGGTDDHTQYLNTTRHNNPALHVIGEALETSLPTSSNIGDTGQIGGTEGFASVDHVHGREQVADLQNSSWLVGAMMLWPSDKTPPPGWLACQGQAVQLDQYPQLFQLIGYSYGGQSSYLLPTYVPNYETIAVTTPTTTTEYFTTAAPAPVAQVPPTPIYSIGEEVNDATGEVITAMTANSAGNGYYYLTNIGGVYTSGAAVNGGLQSYVGYYNSLSPAEQAAEGLGASPAYEAGLNVQAETVHAFLAATTNASGLADFNNGAISTSNGNYTITDSSGHTYSFQEGNSAASPSPAPLPVTTSKQVTTYTTTYETIIASYSLVYVHSTEVAPPPGTIFYFNLPNFNGTQQQSPLYMNTSLPYGASFDVIIKMDDVGYSPPAILPRINSGALPMFVVIPDDGGQYVASDFVNPSGGPIFTVSVYEAQSISPELLYNPYNLAI